MKKPQLSFFQIWNMSFGFLGIQFGWALQLANVSRIFQTLGANVSDIAILWIAAPVTGLILQPIVGHMSDHTWTKLGRRRPFFLLGAIFASIALLIMPNSPAVWIAAGMLWIMDASINISMEPFRAFVGDMLPPEQRTKGFAMQSFFIGVGSVVASALPFVLTNWFGVENTSPAGTIPPSLKIAFYTGGVVFFFAVLYTVLFTKEYSPEEMEAFEKEEEENRPSDKAKVDYDPKPLPASKFYKNAPYWIVVGLISTFLIFRFSHHEEPLILSIGFVVFGLLQLLTGWLTNQGKTKSGLVEIINDLFKMPKTMQQLAWVQFFSWFGLFSMFLYTTSAVTSHIYGTEDTTSKLYNDGADWVNIMFTVYNAVAALIAFALAPIAAKIGRKQLHVVNLIAGGVGLISMYFINNPMVLLVSMIGVGLAWASILSIPYAILTGSLPSRKFGIYMGIFNFFIVLPEITASSIYGFMLNTFFDDQAIYVIITGGLALIVSALLVFRVEDKY